MISISVNQRSIMENHIFAGSTYENLVDVDLRTPTRHCITSELASERHIASSFSPGSLPAKRAHEKISKKIPQSEKPVSTKNYLLRLDFASVAENVCSSVHSLSEILINLLTDLYRKPTHMEKTARHDVQAIKKQKLEGGRFRQVREVSTLQIMMNLGTCKNLAFTMVHHYLRRMYSPASTC